MDLVGAGAEPAQHGSGFVDAGRFAEEFTVDRHYCICADDKEFVRGDGIRLGRFLGKASSHGHGFGEGQTGYEFSRGFIGRGRLIYIRGLDIEADAEILEELLPARATGCKDYLGGLHLHLKGCAA